MVRDEEVDWGEVESCAWGWGWQERKDGVKYERRVKELTRDRRWG